jgi:hypothetical protein
MHGENRIKFLTVRQVARNNCGLFEKYLISGNIVAFKMQNE